LDSVGLRQFGRVQRGGFPGSHAKIGDFGGVPASAEEGGEVIGDLLETRGGADLGGDFDEVAEGVTEVMDALAIEEGVGFPIGEILFRNGAVFETGIDPGLKVRERVEATDHGDGLPAVHKPGIGLGTELAREAGDVSCACH